MSKTIVPIARDISLKLTTMNWQTQKNEAVTASVVPKGFVSSSEFIGQLFPKHQPEFLRREKVLHINQHGFSTWSLFFQAVHMSFQLHYPFAIRPEVLMYLVIHEVATTVKLYPEDYRSLFTRSKEKERIEVRHDGLRMGDPSSPWDELLPIFIEAMKKKVPEGLIEHFLPDFSTATPESTAASIVAFMDAASPYYEYMFRTLCGIPKIRLLGDVEDYRKILAACSQLAERFEKHMKCYFEHLLPVLKTIAEQASGAPLDTAFWSSIYKITTGSGGGDFNGWLSAFINYINSPKGPVQKNEKLYDWTKLEMENDGIAPSKVLCHVSSVPCTWEYHARPIKMRLVGGVLGIDKVDGFVTPSLSYAILHEAK